MLPRFVSFAARQKGVTVGVLSKSSTDSDGSERAGSSPTLSITHAASNPRGKEKKAVCVLEYRTVSVSFFAEFFFLSRYPLEKVLIIRIWFLVEDGETTPASFFPRR